jgi:hypothetical protein
MTQSAVSEKKKQSKSAKFYALSRATSRPSEKHAPTPPYRRRVVGEDGAIVHTLSFSGDGRPVIVDELEFEACREAVEGGILLAAHASPNVMAGMATSAVHTALLDENAELSKKVASLEAELKEIRAQLPGDDNDRRGLYLRGDF